MKAAKLHSRGFVKLNVLKVFKSECFVRHLLFHGASQDNCRTVTMPQIETQSKGNKAALELCYKEISGSLLLSQVSNLSLNFMCSLWYKYIHKNKASAKKT